MLALCLCLTSSSPTSSLDPKLKQLGEDKIAEWRAWFDSRLDDAIEAADQGTSLIECRFILKNS